MFRRWLVVFSVVPTMLALLMGCGGHKGTLPMDASSLSSDIRPHRGGQPPAVPTLYFPPDKSAYTTGGGYCLFAFRSTDPDGDRLKYKVEVFQDGNLMATFDQTQNTSGFLTLQDFLAGAWGNREDFASGEFAYLKANLPRGTYQWRVFAFDGTSWSEPSSLRTFIKR